MTRSEDFSLMPKLASENWKWWHVNCAHDILLKGCLFWVVILCDRKISIHTSCSNWWISMNYSRCHSLFPSYRNHWLLLLRAQSSHSLCRDRQNIRMLWWCPSVLLHRTHSSSWRWWPRRSSRTGRARPSEGRSSLLRNSHSFWCPGKGENCNSLECTKVAEPVSNCSLRNWRECRNLKAILGSREMKTKEQRARQLRQA